MAKRELLATTEASTTFRETEMWTVVGKSILEFNEEHAEEDATDEESNAFFEEVCDGMQGCSVDPYGDEQYLCIDSNGNAYDSDIHMIMDNAVDKNGYDFVKFSDGHHGFVSYGNVGVVRWVKLLWKVHDVFQIGEPDGIEEV